MDKKNKKREDIVVAVSGGFDPLHVGHVRLFKHAKELGGKLVVIINNDNWLERKKGFVFMNQNERAELIRALDVVDEVVFTDHPEEPEDMSVSSILRKLGPDIFANGGDRKTHNTPEDVVCNELGIEMVFNVGRDGKSQSSSWLLGKFLEKHQRD